MTRLCATFFGRLPDRDPKNTRLFRGHNPSNIGEDIDMIDNDSDHTDEVTLDDLETARQDHLDENLRLGKAVSKNKPPPGSTFTVDLEEALHHMRDPTSGKLFMLDIPTSIFNAASHHGDESAPVVKGFSADTGDFIPCIEIYDAALKAGTIDVTGHIRNIEAESGKSIIQELADERHDLGRTERLTYGCDTEAIIQDYNL